MTPVYQTSIKEVMLVKVPGWKITRKGVNQQAGHDRIAGIINQRVCLLTRTRWWFQTFFVFTLYWGNDPI